MSNDLNEPGVLYRRRLERIADEILSLLKINPDNLPQYLGKKPLLINKLKELEQTLEITPQHEGVTQAKTRINNILDKLDKLDN